MSGQDHPDNSPEVAHSSVTQLLQAATSRRSVLRRGAVAGVAGLAVAAGGGGAAAALLSSKPRGDAALSAADASSSGPIVIYLADASTGEMEIFSGTSKTRHTNHAMANMVASMAPR